MSFPKKTIYLAGPITGCNYNDARNGWRKTFVETLKERGADHLHCFSPMREKEFLQKDQCIGATADYDSLHGFGTPQGILTRDSNDVRGCDAMVACFLGATRPSIGTCVEFGIALENRKPIIMVMESAHTVVTERKPAKDVVPREIALRGANPIGKYLLEKGHDIAGGEITCSYYDAVSGDNIVELTVAGKKVEVRNPHDHLFLRACAGYVVPTLDNAADIVQSLLTPGL